MEYVFSEEHTHTSTHTKRGYILHLSLFACKRGTRKKWLRRTVNHLATSVFDVPLAIFQGSEDQNSNTSRNRFKACYYVVGEGQYWGHIWHSIALPESQSSSSSVGADLSNRVFEMKVPILLEKRSRMSILFMNYILQIFYVTVSITSFALSPLKPFSLTFLYLFLGI